MPVTRDKIKKAFVDENGLLTVDVVLTDGVDKKFISWSGPASGIPDDDAAAKALIDANVDFLWNASAAAPYTDAVSDIDTPQKQYNSVKPDKANINSAVSVPELRTQVALLLDAVEELRKLV